MQSIGVLKKDKSKYENIIRSEGKQLKQNNDMVKVFGVLRGFLQKAPKKKTLYTGENFCYNINLENDSSKGGLK